MKLKKILSSTIAMLMFIFIAPITANATPSHQGQKTLWRSLVLILPDASIENYGFERVITTMHYSEIQKVTELSKKIQEDFSKIYFSAHVDVKADYEDLKELSYEGISWNGVKPENVAKQIANNSKYDGYDTILVVYRDVDNTNNSSFLTDAWVQDRNAASQNATYATYALSDGDHSMPQLNKENAELDLLLPMLDSVYREISKTDDYVVSPYTYFDPNDYEKSKEQIYDYMHGGVDGSLHYAFSEFTNAYD